MRLVISLHDEEFDSRITADMHVDTADEAAQAMESVLKAHGLISNTTQIEFVELNGESVHPGEGILAGIIGKAKSQE